MLKPGWYNLVYHNVSNEESDYLSFIGGTIPPIEFKGHVLEIQKLGEIVHPWDGYLLYKSETLRKPIFSIWFDDGLAGVYNQAFPILNELGLKAGVSINSEFSNGNDIFWRMKLSYLIANDCGKVLRSKFKKLGFSNADLLRTFTIDKFSLDVVKIINDVFHEKMELGTISMPRLFVNSEEIKELSAFGWEIGNHTANHYAVSEDSAIDLFHIEFNSCEEFLIKLGLKSKFWVLPFDRKGKRSKNIFDVWDKFHDGRILTFVGNRPNCKIENGNLIYRVFAPVCNANNFKSQLDLILKSPY